MKLLEISEVLGLSVYRSSTPDISESLKVKEGSIIRIFTFFLNFD
jgi:hypothetical protein